MQPPAHSQQTHVDRTALDALEWSVIKAASALRVASHTDVALDLEQALATLLSTRRHVIIARPAPLRVTTTTQDPPTTK